MADDFFGFSSQSVMRPLRSVVAMPKRCVSSTGTFCSPIVTSAFDRTCFSIIAR